VRGEVQIGEGE
jgi:GAF domain-containing protein